MGNRSKTSRESLFKRYCKVFYFIYFRTPCLEPLDARLGRVVNLEVRVQRGGERHGLVTLVDHLQGGDEALPVERHRVGAREAVRPSLKRRRRRRESHRHRVRGQLGDLPRLRVAPTTCAIRPITGRTRRIATVDGRLLNVDRGVKMKRRVTKERHVNGGSERRREARHLPGTLRLG